VIVTEKGLRWFGNETGKDLPKNEATVQKILLFMAVKVQLLIFWIYTLSDIGNINQCTGRMYCLHHLP
jgi:hypothetical protein